MRSLKIIGLIGVLLLVVLFVVPFLIPKDVTLRWVTKAIEERTPLQLKLEDARLAFLPRPSVTLRGVEVKVEVPEQNAALPLFQAKQVSVRSHWNMIWNRRPAVDVSLEQADVHIIATGPERFNYSPLLDTVEKPARQTRLNPTLIRTAQAAENTPQAASPSGPGITLERLDIRKSRLHYKAWKESEQTYPIETLVIDDFKQEDKSTTFHTVLQGSQDHLTFDLDFDTSVQKTTEGSPPWQELAITSKGSSVLKPQVLSIKDQAFEIRSRFRKSNQQLELSDGQVRIGQQAIRFNGVRSESGALDLRMKVDPVQLAYLKTILPPLNGLPPIKGPQVSLRYQASGKSKSPATISGQLKAQEVKLPEYTLTDVSGDILYREPKLQLTNLQGQTLDGRFSGGADIDLGEAKPVYRFGLTLKDIAIEKIASVGSLLTGRGDLKLEAKGRGFEQADWTRTLDGNGDVSLRQLQLKQLQPFAAFFASPAWNVVNKLPGVVDTKALQSAQKLDGQVRDLASQFRIENGVLHVPEIKLNFPQAAAKFSGGIGLDKSLDFKGTLSLDEKLVNALIKDDRLRQALLSGGKSLNVPTKITGTASKPIIQPDEGVMQKHVQAYLTKQVQQEATKTVQKKLLKQTETTGTTKSKEATPPAKPTPSPLKDIQDLLKKPAPSQYR